MGANASRWSSALLLLLTILSRPLSARPLEHSSGTLTPDVNDVNRYAAIRARARTSNWPYLSRRHLSSLPVQDGDASEHGLSSTISNLILLDARDADVRRSLTTSTSETAKSNATLTSTKENHSTEKQSTITPSTTTKKSTAQTADTKSPTATKKTPTTGKSTTDKSTAEKSTTEKSSATDKSTPTSKNKTTKPGSTVTATVTVGKSTETLTVEPTTIPNPTGSETLLSTSIVVPTVTAAPSGPPPPPPPPGKKLKVAIENNIDSNKQVHAYITGVNPSGQLVLLATDGSFYIPSTKSNIPVTITANVALPLSSGTATHYTLPDYISSARVWFAVGELHFAEVATEYGVGLVEPTVANTHDSSESVLWGFAEFTYGADDGLYANLSFVDFVGIPIGMNLTTPTGRQSAPGMHKNGTVAVCNALKKQAKKDGQPWDKLCELDSSGNLIRVLSPSSYLSMKPHAFNGYFDHYTNQVWAKYASESLYIESQSSVGQISCKVDSRSDLLTCDGDNRGYAKPSAADIFSCNSGPFAIKKGDNDVHSAVVPRLCAAFNRATLLIPGGNLQPSLLPKDYYTVTPNNFYSKVVHTAEILGKGYAFPYDDVAPTEKTNVAGLVASSDPTLLTLWLTTMGRS